MEMMLLPDQMRTHETTDYLIVPFVGIPEAREFISSLLVNIVPPVLAWVARKNQQGSNVTAPRVIWYIFKCPFQSFSFSFLF